MEELNRLFDYNRWATLRILDAVEALEDGAIGREVVSSFPTLRATLVHMLGAEWVWLERWRGRSPTAFPDAAALDSLAAVRARWDGLWAEQRDLLGTLDDDSVGAPLAYSTMSGVADERRLDELMRHVVNHGSYHRGQVVTLIRQLGGTPPSTDYVRYLRETS